MGYAFISYSTQNQDSADAMRDFLQRTGVQTWMAPGDIPAGSSYAGVINRAVRDCACFILMLSEEAQNSVWVPKEVERALHYRKTVIPVQIKDVILNDAFEFYLGNTQIVAVQKIDQESEEIKMLLASVLGLAGADKKIGTYELSGKEPRTENNRTKSLDLNGQLTKCSNDKNESFRHDHLWHGAKAAFICGRNYSNFRHIGRGFLGDVYLATDDNNKKCAIKSYPHTNIADIGFLCSEELGLALTHIHHNNLCEIYAIEVSPVPCMVMEYIDGFSLGQMMESHCFSNLDALRIVKSILLGLEALHENNIYYGDITPYNIMVKDDTVKLCDYSLSNYNQTVFSDKTMLSGKYRSPEKNPRSKIDFHSDIFEVGMLLEALTLKQIPDDAIIITDDTIMQLWGIDEKDKLIEIPLRKSPYFTAVECEIYKIVKKAVRINPQERYVSARKMIDDIDKVLMGIQTN